MLLRTHLAFGIFVGLLLFGFAESIILFFLFLILGIMIVDVDTKKSLIGRKWLFRPLQWIFFHRGVFHTLFLCLIFSGIIYYFNSSAGVGFFIGYFSHLILDCFTRSGLKLFWPFFNYKLKFLIKSGGLFEEILFVLLLLVNVFLILNFLLF